MTKAEDFRRKAQEIEAKAESAREAFSRQAFLEIARHWRELADEAERSEQKELVWIPGMGYDDGFSFQRSALLARPRGRTPPAGGTP